jgi:hypothetical protein
VLGTNPNTTESGSFGLGIWSVKGFKSKNPDPDPGAVAKNVKFTNICVKLDSTFLLFLSLTKLFSVSCNMSELHTARAPGIPFPGTFKFSCTFTPLICELAEFYLVTNP